MKIRKTLKFIILVTLLILLAILYALQWIMPYLISKMEDITFLQWIVPQLAGRIDNTMLLIVLSTEALLLFIFLLKKNASILEQLLSYATVTYLVVGSYMLTCVIYWAANSIIDARLQNVIGNYRVNDIYNELINQQTESPKDEAEKNLVKDKLELLILYHHTKAEDWFESGSIFYPLEENPYPSSTILSTCLMNLYKILLKPSITCQGNSEEMLVEDKMVESHNEKWRGLGQMFRKDWVSKALSEYLNSIRESNAYKARRILNGPIQFVTLWVALCGILFILMIQWRDANRFRQLIKYPDQIIPYSPEKKFSVFLRERVSEQQATNKIAITSDEFKNYYEFVRETRDKFTQKLPALDIIHAVCRTAYENAQLKDAQTEATQTMEGRVFQLKDELASRRSFNWFFCSAVPSLGFIGTIWGLSEAMGKAHEVVIAESQLMQEGAIQNLVGGLATAFDTTAVALVLSLPLTFFAIWIARQDEKNIDDLYNRINEDMICLLKPQSDSNTIDDLYTRVDELSNHIENLSNQISTSESQTGDESKQQ